MGLFFGGLGVGLAVTLLGEHVLLPWLKKLVKRS